MKVLLTGLCGKIGITTVRRLLEIGYQVRGFDTKNDFVTHAPGFNEKLVADLNAEGLDFDLLWGDLRNPDDVRKAVGDDVDVVIHLGAITLPNQCEEHWEYTWDVNYYGTRHVIDAIKQSPKKPKLIFPSSIAVYGITPPPRALIKEDEPLVSCCTYGATKIAAELEIQKSGLTYTILRLASSLTPSARHIVMLANNENLLRVFTEYMKLISYDSPMHLLSNYDTNTAILNSINSPESDNRIFNIAGPEDCRVEPRCGGFRVRWLIRKFPSGPQADSHTFLPLVPSSNRKSGSPRYGSPTTFPMSLSVTVVVELQQLTKLV